MDKRMRRLLATGVWCIVAAAAIGSATAGIPRAAHARAPRSRFITLARQLEPSIVQIKAIVIVKTRRQVTTQVTKPILNQRGQIIDYKTSRTVTRVTTMTRVNGGSGVILDRRGYIVTNAHVVYHAKTIRVTLADRRTYHAVLVGMDQRSDLAVIQIPAHDLKPAKLGNSSRLEVGERVMDFGAPFNFAGTVTQGIISALHRRHISVTGETDPHLNMIRHEDYVQTDAPSDPGSSGGALVDMRGDVVGINDSIKSGGAGSFSGVAFAIPSNQVAYVAHDLIQTGHVIHGHGGLQAVSTFARVHRGDATDIIEGIKITNVKPGSAGAAAGIKAGDLITAIDGHRVTYAAQLLHRILFSAPGTKLRLSLLRSGHRMSVTLTVADKPVPGKR